jgi:uncharacterized membrane protein YkvA (DUF1232 family)
MKINHMTFFKKYEALADEYVNNSKKSSYLLDKALNKVKIRKVPVLKMWKNVNILLQLLNDWIKGDYREIPRASLISVIAGILYFVAPVDAIIDIIPLGGYIDDAVVIGFVLKQIDRDIIKYTHWKESKKA